MWGVKNVLSSTITLARTPSSRLWSDKELGTRRATQKRLVLSPEGIVLQPSIVPSIISAMENSLPVPLHQK